MNDDNNVDLLDLDDDASMDTLPEATPLAAPRPKKPWLLLGLGVLIIVLATYIIIKTVGNDESTVVDVDLDAPIVVPEQGDVNANPNAIPVPDAPVAPQPVNVIPQPAPVPVVPAQKPVVVTPQPAPVPAAQPVAQPTTGVPVRVIEDRKDVTFNPSKTAASAEQPAAPVREVAARPAPKKVAQTKTTTKRESTASRAAWYVQFGSYGTRSAAETAQRKIRNAHSGLFQGKEFVVLENVVNGKTMYRLRTPFNTSADANGFCRNAKSDGLDCYVTK